MYTYIHAHTNAHVRRHTAWWLLVAVLLQPYIYSLYACMYIYIYIYMHIYTHTHTLQRRSVEHGRGSKEHS